MSSSPPRIRRAGRFIWQALRPFILVYLIVLLMLSLFERMLVFPAPILNAADWESFDLPRQDVYFTADDGTKLHGWYVDHPDPRAVVLYSHGNGEYVAHLAERLRRFHDELQASVFAWDYRGYGKSQGKPHETNIIADARAAQLWLADRAGIAPEEVVLVGRSLGAAASVQLAAKYPVRALVLERTFSRLTDAAAHHFPWLPVRWLMRNQFRSIDLIKNYHGPLLQVHGAQDEVIPYEQGVRLFEAAPSRDKRFVTEEGGMHNDPLSDEYNQALDEFIASLAAAQIDQ